MSFQSRQKRRRYKRAVEKTKRTRSEEMAKKWFLTLARSDCSCEVCHDEIKKRGEIVYRHDGRQIRCVRCASRSPDSKAFRPSIRWDRWKARQRQQQLAA